MSLLSLAPNTLRQIMNYEGQMVHIGRIVVPQYHDGYAYRKNGFMYKNVVKNGETAPTWRYKTLNTKNNVNRVIDDLQNRYYDLSTQYKVDKNREIIDLFARDPKRDKTFSSLALTAKAFQNAKRARVRVAPILFSRPFKGATYHKSAAESKRHRNAANKAATNLQQKYKQEYLNFLKKHHNTPYYRPNIYKLEENLRVERNQTSKRSSSRNTKPGKRARLELSHGQAVHG
tara:strand:- start:268 stop:960 length:693 start_codon:yes stop_codon:yes gene_type:complete